MYAMSRVAVLIGLLLPTSIMAQTIKGEVVNKNGVAISGATVRVEGESSKTKTDENGYFEIQNLNSGKNEFHVSAAGFAHVLQEINLTGDDQQTVKLVLARTPIEVIDIVATPIHMSVMESASPVSVLAGEALRRQQASTLGDTLEKLPGVQTNFHGNVASTPIIRGLSGPRVLISQNGLDVSDVSRVGPDHSVASEASTSQQIEVLRGPATLFYGSGAIGGVVNVVDGRVPTSSDTKGEWLLEGNSADERKLASFNVTTGTESFAFYADGYWRESSDYEVPVEAELEDDHDHEEEEHEHEGDFVVENSAEESSGFTLGTSYLFDQGYVGAAVEQFDREYGIPGHSHGDERVYADLEQTRIQLLGEYNVEGQWIKKINFRSGFSDYQHSEIEGGEVGTLFENETQELRVDVSHGLFDGWNGGVSFHYKNSEVEAQGEEAFTPPSKTQAIALSIMEEKHFGDVLLQVGARIEHVTLEANNVLLPELETFATEEHDHDEDEDDHDHEEEDHDEDEHDEDEHDHDEDEDEHDHESGVTKVYAVESDFTPISVSAGLVWDFTPGYNVGISVSHSQRAPSASELFSFGAHIGTGSYEVGSFFGLHEEGDETHIELSEQDIDVESANNIDLTFRKTEGDVGFVFNAFYNQVDNYYYQTFTGLYAESAHEHEHEEGEEEEEEELLPIYLFQTDDVVLHGFEAQVAWQVTDSFKTTFSSDYVRAKLKDGGNLPRTSPLRFGLQLSYQAEKLSAHFDVTNYQEQTDVAENETTTEGYTLIDASVSYDIDVLNHDMSLYLKGTNLTDTEARVHTSFIKDIAPRAGRSFAAGIRGYF